MKVLPIRVKNQFWAQTGHNIMELITIIENKRFEGTFDGDIDYGKLLFNFSGMIREIERLQITNNNLQKELDDMKKDCCGECKCQVDPASVEKKQDQPAGDVITD